ncbi:MOG interacting and ectopic P-granules protein 1-like [Liolophura sinensis]|uniref:MOG interacting and ectopic P-granules protein 1-like n=1 Tax=Liolophura sinensis TaxID=3198878 RepID=UPI0031582DD1
MSTAEERANDKLAADTSFLECHKLLKSMEDSTIQLTHDPQTPTPNGHAEERDKEGGGAKTLKIVSKSVNNVDLVNSNDVTTETANHSSDGPQSEVEAKIVPAINGFVTENHESGTPSKDHGITSSQNGDSKDNGEGSRPHQGSNSNHSVHPEKPEQTKNLKEGVDALDQVNTTTKQSSSNPSSANKQMSPSAEKPDPSLAVKNDPSSADKKTPSSSADIHNLSCADKNPSSAYKQYESLADKENQSWPNKPDPSSADDPDPSWTDKQNRSPADKLDPSLADKLDSSPADKLDPSSEDKPDKDKVSADLLEPMDVGEDLKSNLKGEKTEKSEGRPQHEVSVNVVSICNDDIQSRPNLAEALVSVGGLKSAVQTVAVTSPKPIAPKPVPIPGVAAKSSPVNTSAPVVTPAPPIQQQPGGSFNATQKPYVSQPVQNKGGKGKKAAKNSASAAASAPKIPKELGPTASFLCDLGMDLVKEGVYKDLISIQSRKLKADKLSESEVKQLEKLKENYESVSQKNREVKVDYTMKCDKCKFVTESKNVMWLHHEYPHTDSRENMYCSHCSFATRIPVAFNFHMESEHQMRGRIIPKPAFWHCSLCQFETNSKGVLTKHRLKCEKNFNDKLNLCPTSSHVNYCLAYNFYKTPKPAPPPPEPIVKAPIQSKPLIRPPVGRIPVQPVRGPSFVPQTRPVLRQRTPQPPVRMIIQQQPQQHMIIPRPLSQQYAYAPRQSATAPLTVRQMLNTTQGPSQPQIQVKNIPRQTAPVRQPQPDLGLVSCEICKGYVKDKDALRVHFFFAHQIDLSASLLKRAQPPLFCDVCFERFWTSQGLQKHKETLKHFYKFQSPPTQQSGLHICIICGIRVTHLLNHMSSTHNLSLKDFLIAKRCIVCGGSFQNRPSLEIHLASSHGILVKTTPNPNTNPNPVQMNATHRPTLGRPPSTAVGRVMPVAALKPASATTCLICNISFLNNDLLTRHCQHCHASCVGCGMIFVDVAARNRHPCSNKNTNLNQILACHVCKSRVHSRNMKSHVLKYHAKTCWVKLKRRSDLDEMARDCAKRPRLGAGSEVIVLKEDRHASPGNNECQDSKEKQNHSMKDVKAVDKNSSPCDLKPGNDISSRKDGKLQDDRSGPCDKDSGDGVQPTLIDKEKGPSAISEKQGGIQASDGAPTDDKEVCKVKYSDTTSNSDKTDTVKTVSKLTEQEPSVVIPMETEDTG